MNVLAFIPARGGSKGIIKKNLVLLNGKPLIQYTIEAAQHSKYVNDIILSSDDPEIIEFSETLGLKVSYVRPSELATDESPTIDAIIDVLEWYSKTGRQMPDCVLTLQPTSPLRESTDIDKAVELYVSKNSKSLISVHQCRENPVLNLELRDDSWSFVLNANRKKYRRQLCGNYCHINGAIYITNTEFILREKTLISERETELFLMDADKSIDIDDMFDLRLAEYYLKYSK
ncbi:MAG: acylneuraminate cytidylyltransferase family protein [Candidatus Ancaeobacter aquaticus]|nr:acylneuraminate cytidylyltransferase family protein [Candidatus Ancaeobacter aquaticus]